MLAAYQQNSEPYQVTSEERERLILEHMSVLMT